MITDFRRSFLFQISAYAQKKVCNLDSNFKNAVNVTEIRCRIKLYGEKNKLHFISLSTVAESSRADFPRSDSKIFV